jgi:hypothetical protein
MLVTSQVTASNWELIGSLKWGEGKAFVGSNMALIVGGWGWEDGKGEKSRQKREWQKAGIEVSDIEKKRLQNFRGFSFSQRRWWRFISSEVFRISRRRNVSEDLRLINASHGSGDILSAFYRGGSGSTAGQFDWNVRWPSSIERRFCRHVISLL